MREINFSSMCHIFVISRGLPGHSLLRSQTNSNLALIRPDTTGTTEFLALILRLNFNQQGGQEELKGVPGKRVHRTLNLKNLHRFLQTIEVKFTFGDSGKFANVHIFEAIKKELGARVMEISGMVSWEKKPNLFKEKSRFLL